MNAAAAHAAFVMTVSAARMYWLLRHAQHPLPEKKSAWALPIFCTVDHPSYTIFAPQIRTYNALTLQNWYTILTKALFLKTYYCTTM